MELRAPLRADRERVGGSCYRNAHAIGGGEEHALLLNAIVRETIAGRQAQFRSSDWKWTCLL